MPKILAISDLHGNLPPIPECDLLIIAGDVCPMWDHHVDVQLYWLNYDFRNWLADIPARKIIGIAGNHDFVFETHPASVDNLHLTWTYLRDSETTFEGLRIYGLPWVPNLPGWAFYASRERLAKYYGQVPKGIDIVVSHGPPHKYGDHTSKRYGNLDVGCRAANDMLHRARPKAMIYGHIHEGYGHYRFKPQHGDEIDLYNVAYVDENYVMRDNATVEIMIDAKQKQTDQQREIRDQDSDSRQLSEPTQRSEFSLHAVAQAEDPETLALAAC